MRRPVAFRQVNEPEDAAVPAWVPRAKSAVVVHRVKRTCRVVAASAGAVGVSAAHAGAAAAKVRSRRRVRVTRSG